MNKKQDDFIKKSLQSDKYMSEEVENIINKYKGEIQMNDDKSELKRKKVKISLKKFITIAASFIAVVGVGGYAYFYNVKELKKEDKGILASQEQNKEIVSEGDFIKATLKNNNTVIINIKNTIEDIFKEEKYTEIDYTKDYVVADVVNKIENVFVGKEGNKTYVMLLVEDGTVEYVDVMAGFKEKGKIEFRNAGKVAGINDTVGFKQDKTEDEGKIYNRIIALQTDGAEVVLELVKTIDSVKGYIGVDNQEYVAELKSDNSIILKLDNKTYTIPNDRKIDKLYTTNAGNDMSPILLLLMEDKTVEYIDIQSRIARNGRDFKIDGKIENSKNVKNIKEGKDVDGDGIDDTVLLTTTGTMIVEFKYDEKNKINILKAKELNDSNSKIRELSQEELEKYENLFMEERYNGFLTCEYETLGKMDLSQVFYNGAGISRNITEEEKSELVGIVGEEAFYLDNFAIDKEKAKELLAMNIDNFSKKISNIYLEKYNSYYLFHSDTNFANIHVVSGTINTQYSEIDLIYQKDNNTYTVSFTDEDGNISIYRNVKN